MKNERRGYGVKGMTIGFKKVRGGGDGSVLQSLRSYIHRSIRVIFGGGKVSGGNVEKGQPLCLIQSQPHKEGRKKAQGEGRSQKGKMDKKKGNKTDT